MIYLDNAATTFPKPPSVVRDITDCMRHDCGNPGRGSHALAMRAAEHIYRCREEIATFFGFHNTERVCFTVNATAALNTVIKGALREGDHVLISDMEHNAVLRPIIKLADAGRITYDVFPTHALDPGRTPQMICREIFERIRPNTRMLICAHASNICSASLPLSEIGALCKRFGILFVVDAAQSAGHLPINVEKMQIDALCVPGHKGLMGPQGIGFFLLSDGISLDTLTEGGSGFHSLDPHMPDDAPERYEAGTLPTPAITGLASGIREIKSRGVDEIHAKIKALNARLQERLLNTLGITVYAPHHVGSVLSFNADKIRSDALATELDRRGFCVRAGYHCAPLAHKTLATPDGGTVRVSPSIYTTAKQIDAFAEAVREILQ